MNENNNTGFGRFILKCIAVLVIFAVGSVILIFTVRPPLLTDLIYAGLVATAILILWFTARDWSRG